MQNDPLANFMPILPGHSSLGRSIFPSPPFLIYFFPSHLAFFFFFPLHLARSDGANESHNVHEHFQSHPLSRGTLQRASGSIRGLPMLRAPQGGPGYCTVTVYTSRSRRGGFQLAAYNVVVHRTVYSIFTYLTQSSGPRNASLNRIDLSTYGPGH